MKTAFRLLPVVLLLAVLSGCETIKQELASVDLMGTGQKAAWVGDSPSFPALDSWLSRNMLVVTAGQDGQMDYDRAYAQGAAIVYGEGLPSETAFDSGSKRMTAMRAAEVVAQRNLADFLAGNPRGAGMQAGGQFNRSNNEMQPGTSFNRTEAFIKGAVIVAQDYNPQSERAAVLLRYDLKGNKGF